jgi:hypothetical protein
MVCCLQYDDWRASSSADDVIVAGANAENCTRKVYRIDNKSKHRTPTELRVAVRCQTLSCACFRSIILALHRTIAPAAAARCPLCGSMHHKSHTIIAALL